MAVVIEDFDAVVVDEPDSPTGPSASDAAAPPQPALQAWLGQRDLVAEREARLAID